MITLQLPDPDGEHELLVLAGLETAFQGEGPKGCHSNPPGTRTELTVRVSGLRGAGEMIAVEELDQLASKATAIRVTLNDVILIIPIVLYLGYRNTGKLGPLAHQVTLTWITDTPQIDGVGPIAP